MKIQGRKSLTVSFVLALGLSTALFGGIAHAADTAKTTPKITGQHLVFMQGFNGETPSTALYHLTIKKNSGNAFIGTQRWRDCTDNIEKCKTEGTTGTGWTEAEAVFLVRTSSNTFVLRSGKSQGQITVGKKGLTKAYVLGDAGGKVSRTGGLMQLTAYSLSAESCPPPVQGSPPSQMCWDPCMEEFGC